MPDGPYASDAFPRMPRRRPGIGVVGYGRVAKRWHVPMYQRFGLNVVAICDERAEALGAAADDWPGIKRHTDYAELLADPAVEVVDLATPPPGRLELVKQAVQARRHVLAQKPLSVNRSVWTEVVDLADDNGILVAVNQNGRFAPAWRRTTELLRAGVLGRLRAITHMYDTSLKWRFDATRHANPQFLLFDYSNHWIDICGYWLDPDPILAVQAKLFDSVQHPDGTVQQSMWVAMESASAVDVLIRGAAAGLSHRGHGFVLQGDLGTLRGRSTASRVSASNSTTAHDAPRLVFVASGLGTPSQDRWWSCCSRSRSNANRSIPSPTTGERSRWSPPRSRRRSRVRHACRSRTSRPARLPSD